MERLTTNKPVKKMDLCEPVYNNCYAKDGEAWYRDYNIDISCRNLIREIYKKNNIKEEDEFWTDKDYFDFVMYDNLQYGFETLEGISAIIYQQMWGKAYTREKLYRYEQAEEEGRLLVLPCKIGTVLYDAELSKFPQRVIGYRIGRMMGEDEEDFDEDHEMETLYMESEGCGISMSSLTLDIGKNIFLTREGAEAKRKEMEESK